MAATERVQRSSVTPLTGYAVAATAAAVGLPVAATWALLTGLSPDPPLPATAAFATAISMLVTVGATQLWRRHPASMELSFGELMLWAFARRWWAEKKLRDGARRLGIDGSSDPVTVAPVSRDEQLDVLQRLTHALEAKDPYTHGHSRRVERYAYRTALALHLTALEIDELRTAAALHDVGKIRVPDAILRKPGALTLDERIAFEQHPVIGARMIAGVGDQLVFAAVLSHHERWDGTGYPDGLSREAIPLFARIIAVADAYDAMTSTRPYRAALSRRQAIAELELQAGTQFDPDVVTAFVSTLRLPAPVAALLPFLPFLPAGRRMVREVGFMAKRMGTGSIASGATAAGAALVMGAVSLGAPPSLEAHHPAAQAPASRVVGAITPPSQPAGQTTAKVRPDGRSSRKKADVAAAPVAQSPEPVVAGKRIHAARPAQPASSDEVAPSRDDPPSRRVRPAVPDEETPEQDRPSAPESSPRATRGPDSPTDPQPDKGRDCDSRGRGDGKGHAYHCG